MQHVVGLMDRRIGEAPGRRDALPPDAGVDVAAEDARHGRPVLAEQVLAMGADGAAEIPPRREGVGQRAFREQGVGVARELVEAEWLLHVADAQEHVVRRVDRGHRVVDRGLGIGEVVLEREFQGLADGQVALDPGAAYADIVGERFAEAGLAHGRRAEIELELAADAQFRGIVRIGERDALFVEGQRLAGRSRGAGEREGLVLCQGRACHEEKGRQETSADPHRAIVLGLADIAGRGRLAGRPRFGTEGNVRRATRDTGGREPPAFRAGCLLFPAMREGSWVKKRMLIKHDALPSPSWGGIEGGGGSAGLCGGSPSHPHHQILPTRGRRGA